MISKKLKLLFLLTLILIAAHGVEEFNTKFLYIDESNRFFANLLNTKEEIFYWAFHIMWWLMLIVVYLLIMGGKWALIPLTLFGIVYVFEIHHMFKGFQTGGYYPGMLTALFYPVLGIFYWKELIKNWRVNNGRS